MAPLVTREEMSERHLVGTGRDPVPMCKVSVRSVVVALYRVYHGVFSYREAGSL